MKLKEVLGLFALSLYGVSDLEVAEPKPMYSVPRNSRLSRTSKPHKPHNQHKIE